MSTHFWFGGEDSPYLVKNSAKFDENKLTRTPSDQDPWEVGKTGEIDTVLITGGTNVPGGDLFAPVIYTGTGNTQSIDVGFPVDLVWIKARTDNSSNQLLDTVRGVRKTSVSYTHLTLPTTD